MNLLFNLFNHIYIPILIGSGIAKISNELDIPP